MTHGTTFSTETQVLVPSQVNSERADILALADACLEEHNTAWATFIATGNDAAYIAALAARQDREALLAQVGGEDD